MKIAGIVGGIGPESTIDYYRMIVASYLARAGTYPSLIINSVDLRAHHAAFEAQDRPAAIHFQSEAITRLARAGADFGAFAANTPHLVFDELRRASPIPLISLVEATREVALAQGFERVALIGTRWTMAGGFYESAFASRGITVIVPRTDEQLFIHDRYMGELVKGVFLPETRRQLLAVVERLRAQEGIEALILGGTELPLILRDADAGIPFLDTSRIHVAAIVAELLA